MSRHRNTQMILDPFIDDPSLPRKRIKNYKILLIDEVNELAQQLEEYVTDGALELIYSTNIAEVFNLFFKKNQMVLLYILKNRVPSLLK